MDATQRKQLLELANFLDDLPEDNWTMTLWHGHAHQLGAAAKHGESRFETPVQAMECGTACCVAGWAALLNSEEWIERFGTESNCKVEGNPTVLRVSEHCFRDFFGISRNASDQICTENLWADAPHKATEIREIVELDGEAPYYCDGEEEEEDY